MPKRVLAVVCVTISLFLAGCSVNPVTGQEELMFFSPEKDVQLGREYGPKIEQALHGRIPDETLQSYVDHVGQRVARVCHRPDLSYYFTAVQEESENALAVPGGYIYITSGLLRELKSESQLAAVLAHEVGHVVARDTMAALSRQIGMTALVGAAAGVGGRGSGDALAGASFVTGVLALQYSREDERDADLTGLSYMVQAGYDPQGMVETMQILQELQTVRPVEFFSTHPNPSSRIAYIEERISRRYAKLGALKQGQSEYEEAVLSRLKDRKSWGRQPTSGSRAGK